MNDEAEPDDVFMPYYYDCVQYIDRQYGNKRGRVFWRSMDRIRCILINVVAKAFAEDLVIKHGTELAIEALEFIRRMRQKVESSISLIFSAPLSHCHRMK